MRGTNHNGRSSIAYTSKRWALRQHGARGRTNTTTSICTRASVSMQHRKPLHQYCSRNWRRGVVGRVHFIDFGVPHAINDGPNVCTTIMAEQSALTNADGTYNEVAGTTARAQTAPNGHGMLLRLLPSLLHLLPLLAG